MARRRIYPTNETQNGQEELLHTPLDRPRIINAALNLLQAEGLEPITMRRIADYLGVKAASLYYHVKDKEHLIYLLGEKIRSEIELPSEDLDWREQLKNWANNFRQILKLYRDSVQIMNATTFTASPHRFLHIEYLFRILAEKGFNDSQIPWFASMLKNYVLGFVDEENRIIDRSNRTDYPSHFQALPKEKYPHINRLAEFTMSSDYDHEFLCGIKVLLDGFESQLTLTK